jgi:hypothetical protein
MTLPRTLTLSLFCSSAVLATALPAAATQLPNDAGARFCQTVPNGHGRSLEMCVGAIYNDAQGDSLGGAADITAYSFSKKQPTPVQDNSVQVQAYAAQLYLDGSPALGQGYPFAPTAGYSENGTRGIAGLTSGRTYQVSVHASFSAFDKKGNPTSWDVVGPTVSYTAP